MKPQKYNFSSKGIDLNMSELMSMKEQKEKREEEKRKKKKKGDKDPKKVKLPNNTTGTVE